MTRRRDYDPGEAVTLTGKCVAPKRIADYPECHTAWMIADFLDLPFCTLETETILAPQTPLWQLPLIDHGVEFLAVPLLVAVRSKPSGRSKFVQLVGVNSS
jgi:hypothetical protein